MGDRFCCWSVRRRTSAIPWLRINSAVHNFKSNILSLQECLMLICCIVTLDLVNLHIYLETLWLDCVQLKEDESSTVNHLTTCLTIHCHYKLNGLRSIYCLFLGGMWIHVGVKNYKFHFTVTYIQFQSYSFIPFISLTVSANRTCPNWRWNC